MLDRVCSELERLKGGGIAAELVQIGPGYVVYRGVPTAGTEHGLAPTADVIVPIPSGYPAALIDLAGLPAGSPFLQRVKGGQNSQGVVQASGVSWQLASYHPHNGGGGPPWNPA